MKQMCMNHCLVMWSLLSDVVKLLSDVVKLVFDTYTQIEIELAAGEMLLNLKRQTQDQQFFSQDPMTNYKQCLQIHVPYETLLNLISSRE